jgi:hypothetical protein
MNSTQFELCGDLMRPSEYHSEMTAGFRIAFSPFVITGAPSAMSKITFFQSRWH